MTKESTEFHLAAAAKMRSLATNPSQILARNEAALNARVINRREADKILEPLKKSGIEAEILLDLRQSDEVLAKSIPCLSNALFVTNNTDIKHTILILLSTTLARQQAWDAVINEYRNSLSRGDERIAWAAAEAIAKMSGKKDDDALLDFASDRSAGVSRGPIVLALHSSRAAAVETVLIDLLRDPDVRANAAMVLGKRKCNAAKPHLESLLADADKVTIREARRALQRIASSA